LGRRLLPVGVSLSDYFDVLLDPGCQGEAARALAEGIMSDARWERLDFEELPPDAAARVLMLAPALTDDSAAQSACPTLELAAPLDAVLPKAKRRTLNLARNRTARRGGAVVERAREGGVEAALGHLFRLHARRWQNRGSAGVLAEERVRCFHLDAAPALARMGLLRLYTLELAGAVVAAQCGFHHAGQSYAYISGFDPDCDFESPGVILMAHAIEEALREGARAFHFLRGREAYKYGWGALDRWNCRRTIVRESCGSAA
jgi:CelD/BcsL family acetyltransferase involved in cellulose biosynthesis